MMSRYLLISIFVVAAIVPATAQITLHQYQESVVEYSHTFQRAQAAVEGAYAELQVAKKNLLPSLDMSRDATYNLRGGDGERALGWSMRADIVQPLFYGGEMMAAKSRAEMLWCGAVEESEATRLAVVYDAVVAYWSLSRAEIYYHAIERYKNIVESLRDVALHRFEEGYTSKSDLLQVESRLSDAEYQLSLAKQRWQQALHTFNTFRGVDPEYEVTLKESILDGVQMPERESIEEVIASHPDYVSSVAEREASRWSVRIRSAEYLPRVGLNIYGLWHPNIPNIKGSGTRLDGGVAISVSSPIFHFGQRRAALRSARSDLRSMALAVEDVADRIRLDESNGWTNLVATQRRCEAIRHNLDLATENLDISTYAYGEGMATILDVMQAQLSWLQIYTNAIAAQYDYAVAVAAYRYIVAR